MNLKEKTVQKKKIYSGRVVKLDIHKVKLPDGKFSHREIITHPGAVAIVPILPGNKIILIKQFRKPTEKTLLEIPAGTLDKNESPRKCAFRELVEETGYRARCLKKIMDFYPSPGYSNERIHVFTATGLTKTQSAPEADEFIKVVIIPLEKIKKLIKAGKIKDGKTLLGLSCLR